MTLFKKTQIKLDELEQEKKNYMKDLDKFIGLIKPFSLMELYGLNCVVNKLNKTKAGKSLNLVRGEIQSILTIYKSRNVFDIVEA